MKNQRASAREKFTVRNEGTTGKVQFYDLGTLFSCVLSSFLCILKFLYRGRTIGRKDIQRNGVIVALIVKFCDLKHLFGIFSDHSNFLCVDIVYRQNETMGAKALINAHPKNVLGSKGARRCRVCGTSNTRDVFFSFLMPILTFYCFVCFIVQPIRVPLSANIIYTCADNVFGNEQKI